MKKILLSVLCAIMIVGIATGCGNKTTTNENNDNLDNNANNNVQSKYEKDKDLPATIDVNLSEVKYCVDGPNKQVFNNGFLYSRGHYDSKLGHVDSYFVIYDNYMDTSSELLYGVKKDNIKTPSDIIVEMKEQIIRGLEYAHFRATRYDYKITNQKEVKINGYDMFRFEGTFNLLYDIENPAVDYTEADFVGYSLIKDGIPIYFIVGERPNESNQIDIGKLADKIAKTLREYDGNCSDD